MKFTIRNACQNSFSTILVVYMSVCYKSNKCFRIDPKSIFKRDFCMVYLCESKKKARQEHFINFPLMVKLLNNFISSCLILPIDSPLQFLRCYAHSPAVSMSGFLSWHQRCVRTSSLTSYGPAMKESPPAPQTIESCRAQFLFAGVFQVFRLGLSVVSSLRRTN